MEKFIRQKQSDTEIIQLHNDLVLLVKRMRENKEVCFTSVLYEEVTGGNYWQPVEEIKGDYLFKYIDNDPEWVLETSKMIADDYQKVVLEYLHISEQNDNLLEEGRKWLFDSLSKWSGAIVEKGWINHQEIADLVEAFEEIIRKRGIDFFGYAHGNIIGDHIYVGEDKTLYLFGMRVVPRPGKGYYDFLRALDWILLKADSKKINFNCIVGWMKQYLSEYDWEEVKLVFSLRCIGILGWDMLHRGDYGKGDFETKKKLLLKFIKRGY